jgi:hypothetical protein
MTTTLFVDFGLGIGMGNTLSTTVGAYRSIFGATIGTGTDMTEGTNSFPGGLNAASSLDFTPLNYDFDLNGVTDNNDIVALANAVVPIMQRTLEPFDINVVVEDAANLADAQTSVNLNAGDASGEFDAYVFVTTITSNGFAPGDNSVGNQFRLNGRAAGLDLNAQNGNTRDEAALTFADTIFDDAGTPGTVAFNENLAFRLAFTTTHEAFHTFSYIHTSDTPADQELLTSGDVIRVGSNTRENPFIVTRFDLPHDNPVTEPNNYLLAANDADIGLRDDDLDGIPNLAYVSGTGAHDRITLGANTGRVDVTVNANRNQARTSSIASEFYSINLSSDTEGGILVDASINSDEVVVDARATTNFRLRGGTGVDPVSSTESDLLTLQSNGLSGAYTPGVDAGAGTVNYAGGAQINFSEFENVEAANIPITINPLTLSNFLIQEGGTLFLNGSFINIDTLDTHEVMIDWGDGSTPTALNLATGLRTFNAAHQYLDDNPTGTPIDIYRITVTVTDQDEDAGTIQSGIFIANVAPTLNLTLSPTTINENGVVTLTGTFVDPGLPDTHTVAINWGDGTTSNLFVNQNQLSRTFQITHQYQDDNPTGTPFDIFPITVTVTDDDTGSTQGNTSVRINNVVPTIAGLALSSTVINENDTVTLSGTFTDPGLRDTHIVTINWGDGTTSTLPINQNQLTRKFQITHKYLDDNPFTGTPSDILPITVKVTDDDTGSAQASTVVQVNNINPVITSFTSNANFVDRARAGKPININATFADIGTLDTHRAFVDWGDGTSTQEVIVLQGSGSGAIQGSHIYAKGGAFTLKLILRDDDTGEDIDFTRAIIIGIVGGPG